MDGIAREEVSATYAGGYHKVPEAQSDATLRLLQVWRGRGLTVLTLDYADSRQLAEYAAARARAYGLIPYVATKLLDQIFTW